MTCASTKCPMRALAMTGIETACDDAVDHVRVGHARDAALRADVGGDPLEGHDGDGARVLGDLGLLGRDDVHDDAALEHLRHAALDPVRTDDWGHVRHFNLASLT